MQNRKCDIRRVISRAGLEMLFPERQRAAPDGLSRSTNPESRRGNPAGAARVSRVAMKNSTKEKVVIPSAACAVFTLALLLAPVPARCGDSPAPLTVNHGTGNYEYIDSSPWVKGISGPDNPWAAHRDHDSIYLRISSAPQALPRSRRQSMSIYCTNRPHRDDCPADEHCARTPDRDGPHFVDLDFTFDSSWRPPVEPQRKNRELTSWLKKNAKVPLLVGLWSKSHTGDAPPEGANGLRLEMEHYPRTEVQLGPSIYTVGLRGVQASELIRKLPRVESVVWTDDDSGQSSSLVTVDKGLREQIGILMEFCGFDPAPAP